MTGTPVDGLVEDIAVWLETCARGGRLGQRMRMAEQLRTGAWRTMPRRRGAPADVARARAALTPAPPIWRAGDVVDLNDFTH